MKPLSVKKSVSETYLLRFDDPMCLWAKITIDEYGTFNAQSDNGNFQYHWGYHGRKSFKHFIIELARDKHYFLNKVSQKDEFNADVTECNWKRKIVKWLKDGLIEYESARITYDNITELFRDTSNQEEIAHERYYGELFDCIETDFEDFELVMDYSAGAKHFASAVMPEFAKIIKVELDGAEEPNEK